MTHVRRVPYRRTMAIRYSEPSCLDSQIVQLQRIIATTRINRSLPGYTLIPKFFGHSVATHRIYGVDCDEVYPNLFIGDEGAARNIAYLKLMGITHVLNCAEGRGLCYVDTGHVYYAASNIKYMGLHVMDVPQANISIHFQDTANFIERAMNERGKVLVHCMVGVSRSATIAIVYLMIKRKMSAEEALRTVRRHREVRPNDGFLRQLLDLERK